MHGPADEAWIVRFFQKVPLFSGESFDAVLLRIGRNDLEIVALSERNQTIACAAAGVDSAQRGSDTRAFLDKGNAAIEVAAPEKDMIKQSREFIRRPGEGWRKNRTSGYGKKESARNHP
jgi:hypothetical protein